MVREDSPASAYSVYSVGNPPAIGFVCFVSFVVAPPLQTSA